MKDFIHSHKSFCPVKDAPECLYGKLDFLICNLYGKKEGILDLIQLKPAEKPAHTTLAINGQPPLLLWQMIHIVIFKI